MNKGGRRSRLGSGLALALLWAPAACRRADPGSTLAVSRASAPAAPDGLPVTSLSFPGGASISVEIAATPELRARGLMFRESLPRDYGMLFVFPWEQPLEFWMKNTWVDLDMVFIDRDRKVLAVFENVPRSWPDTPESALARRMSFGQYVLELPAGAARRYGLKAGAQLAFEAPRVER